nr:NADH dehydrogenase subunit 5 [Bopyrella malensis]
MGVWGLNYYKMLSGCLGVIGVLLCGGCLKLLISSDSYFLDYEFFSMSGWSMGFVLSVDWMSVLFMCFICWISGSILLYSSQYMEGERSRAMFLVLLVCFISSMGLVVFSLNMVSIMLGWDGLGLVSFLLVIYYQNSSSVSGATITALSNRVGDGMVLLVIGVSVDCGSWSISDLMLLLSSEEVALTGGLIILAAITKSAQLPFSAWLPRAMAAPTPVSSLVHSSTLVTAGIYLLLRSSEALSVGGWGNTMLILGLITMLLASVSANYEQDLKKVVALSTLSQLGLMVVSLGLGLTWITLFHLLMHAVFKALLFMCSGEVIHQAQGAQDLRFMGGLYQSIPFTGVLMNCCSLSLCGIPFLCGFYSKDAIMELGYSSSYSSIFLGLMAFSVGLSACYSLRLSVSGFINEGGFSLSGVKEDSKEMFFSKSGLFLLVLVSGAGFMVLLDSSPLLMLLSVSEKTITLLATLGGFLLGMILNQFNDYTIWSLTKSWFLGGLSGLGFLSSLSGEIMALLLASLSKFSVSTEIWVSQEASSDFSSQALSKVSSWGFLAQRSGMHSYLLLFGVVSLILVI